jgi:hypothetical protein
MSATPRHIVQFETSGEIKHLLESEAARLHLTVGAYVEYLIKRPKAGIPPTDFDRVVTQVFGRYGNAMRKLAQ